MSEKFELLVSSSLTISQGVEDGECIHGETGMFAQVKTTYKN